MERYDPSWGGFVHTLFASVVHEHRSACGRHVDTCRRSLLFHESTCSSWNELQEYSMWRTVAGVRCVETLWHQDVRPELARVDG
eukprot:4135967-Amphidinium_carterae.1